MSHSKIRTEKICLNCGTETPGRYCPACGQENIEPKQTVWHLVTHFFSDLTHFDGKFFVTVKDLFAKPGFLSREYMIGRRASYLDPIRMYIFTSAFFFLIFFSLFDVKKMHIGGENETGIQKDQDLQAIMSQAGTAEDSMIIQKVYGAPAKNLMQPGKDRSNNSPGVNSQWTETDYHSVAAYDSAQKALSPDKRDGWLKRRINIKKIELSLRYEKEHGDLFRELAANFMHNSPKLLFVSLPLFALILKFLYIRRKQFYYVDHGIFSIHLYIFSFLILLLYFGISGLRDKTGWNSLQWLNAVILIYPLFYYYKAMRRFYGQDRGKTILKYILLFILSFFVQLVIFTGAILFTVYEA